MLTRRVAIAGGLAGITLASTLSETPGRAADNELGKEFNGKCLIVELKSEPNHGRYIESARVKKLGDRSFLVGTGIKCDRPSFKPYVGVVQWIPVDEIRWIGVYSSLEELTRNLPEPPKQT